MTSSARRHTPTWGSPTDVVPVWDAGAVRAHGVESFPRYFIAMIRDPDLPFDVGLHIHTADGGSGSNVTGLQVAPRGSFADQLPSMSTVYAGLPLEEWTAVAVGLMAAGASRVDTTKPKSGQTRGQAEAEIAAQATIAYRAPRPRLEASFLKRVAQVYRDAVSCGDNPTRAVLAALGGPKTGYSTAQSWVAKARAAGYLGKAVKGRPGEVAIDDEEQA